MGVVIPAILSASGSDVAHKLSRLADLRARRVQLDVVDGIFAKPATWPYSGNGTLGDLLTEDGLLPHLSELEYEVDLMVGDPGKVIGEWIEAGANRITIHAESTTSLTRVLAEVNARYGHSRGLLPGMLSLGLAINVATDANYIEPYLRSIDYVQFMGIARIGRQGEPFDKRLIPKIRAFKKKHPQMRVQVDGGVNKETLPLLLRAGVDRAVVGSALWKAPNLRAELASFDELTHTYGIYDGE